MAKTMLIRELTRVPAQNPNDTLCFEPGVNVIVGPPNAGKTQWLKILDYLLGDDKPAEESLAAEVIEKYQAAILTMSIAGKEFVVERRWKEPGFKAKVIVDGSSMNRLDFCHELMTLLDIPTVHYPQGDPYGPRSWPELSWRSLMRHIYRQQRFWTDLADRQPESEQHACLSQFLGMAKDLFSDEYGKLVQGNKNIQELKQKKENFLSMLQEVSLELIDAEDLGIALTPQSIDTASNRLQKEIVELQEKRDTLLKAVLDSFSGEAKSTHKETIQCLGEDLARLQTEREALLASLQKADERLAELEAYRRLVQDELSRIQRAGHASQILTAIRITHCPACDREIPQPSSETSKCNVCHRPMQTHSDIMVDPQQRLEFERRQLSAEIEEAKELVAALGRERDEARSRIERINERIRQIQTDLRPTRTAAAAIMPPEIAVCDIQIGRLEERLQQLKRIASSLNKREEISTEIAEIQKQVATLEAKVSEQNANIDFDRKSNVLADSINSYLNLMHHKKPMLWSQKAVAVDFRKRDFRIFVGEGNWRSKLGGTATLIFLMAYHYGLMALSNESKYNYPGLLILDFPAELDDGSTVGDKENFVLEPFVDLLRRDDMVATQVIASGSSFENLKGANRIEFHHIWK